MAAPKGTGSSFPSIPWYMKFPQDRTVPVPTVLHVPSSPVLGVPSLLPNDRILYARPSLYTLPLQLLTSSSSCIPRAHAYAVLVAGHQWSFRGRIDRGHPALPSKRWVPYHRRTIGQTTVGGRRPHGRPRFCCLPNRDGSSQNY